MLQCPKSNSFSLSLNHLLAKRSPKLKKVAFSGPHHEGVAEPQPLVASEAHGHHLALGEPIEGRADLLPRHGRHVAVEAEVAEGGDGAAWKQSSRHKLSQRFTNSY